MQLHWSAVMKSLVSKEQIEEAREMQLSAVCAAATVSALPGRQTEEGCSLSLTLLTLGQHNATNRAEANKEHTAMFTMLLPCGCAF